MRLERPADLLIFLASLAITTGLFAADMAIFQPRCLPLVRGMLHPHWPRF